MTLGQKLYKARRDAKMTAKALSDKTGVSSSTIRNYENDRSDPLFFNLCCIATTLNLSLDYLAGNTSTTERKP